MNNYITLDGNKYPTPASEWLPITLKPATVRYLLSGTVDVTYGPAAPIEWRGHIRAPISAAVGYGTITTLRATVAKRTGLSFIDHYGNSYTVHLIGEISEESLTPVWDGVSNVFHLPVRLVKA